MNQTITPRERAVLNLIRLSDPAEGCHLSNSKFTRKLGIGARQVRTCLASLRGRKLLTVRIVGGNQRTIRLTAKGLRLIQRR